MLNKENLIFGSVMICKEYDMKTNSINNLISDINFDEMDEICFYVSNKRIGEETYKVFFVFSNDNKFLIADQFDIPNDDSEADLLQYNKVYSFKKNTFPKKGLYSCELYAITQKEYEEHQANFEKNGNQSLYDYLRNDSNYLLDLACFEII